MFRPTTERTMPKVSSTEMIEFQTSYSLWNEENSVKVRSFMKAQAGGYEFPKKLSREQEQAMFQTLGDLLQEAGLAKFRIDLTLMRREAIVMSGVFENGETLTAENSPEGFMAKMQVFLVKSNVCKIKMEMIGLLKTPEKYNN